MGKPRITPRLFFCRCCCRSARCCATPTRTTLSCPRSRGSTRQTSTSTTTAQRSGRENMPCDFMRRVASSWIHSSSCIRKENFIHLNCRSFVSPEPALSSPIKPCSQINKTFSNKKENKTILDSFWYSVIVDYAYERSVSLTNQQFPVWSHDKKLRKPFINCFIDLYKQASPVFQLKYFDVNF